MYKASIYVKVATVGLICDKILFIVLEHPCVMLYSCLLVEGYESKMRCETLFPISRSIQGFMQKMDAEKLLLQCSPGTFLIRFSEGDPGGISVAWVTGIVVILHFFRSFKLSYV